MKGSRFNGVKSLAPVQEKEEQGLIFFRVYKIRQPPHEENRLASATAVCKPIFILSQGGAQASR